jgi:outer membrane murein-binding lipoprotein Lpp
MQATTQTLMPFFMFLLATLQALIFWMLGQSAQERREMRAKMDDLAGQVTSLNAHVGVDGNNGIKSRLDEIAHKLDKVAEEMAELRGERRRPVP